MTKDRTVWLLEVEVDELQCDKLSVKFCAKDDNSSNTRLFLSLTLPFPQQGNIY